MINIERGTVYWVDLPDSDGREIRDIHPALVISNDQQNKHSPLITVLPLTSKVDKIYPFQVPTLIKGKEGVVLVDQIRTIDRKRFGDKIEELDWLALLQVEKALHKTLQLKCCKSRL